MKVKEHFLDQRHDGELSNRLYKLDELNRLERALADRNFKLFISGICALGMFCIVLAMIGGAP